MKPNKPNCQSKTKKNQIQFKAALNETSNAVTVYMKICLNLFFSYLFFFASFFYLANTVFHTKKQQTRKNVRGRKWQRRHVCMYIIHIICMCVCMYICVYICEYVCMCVCIYMCALRAFSLRVATQTYGMWFVNAAALSISSNWKM